MKIVFDKKKKKESEPEPEQKVYSHRASVDLGIGKDAVDLPIPPPVSKPLPNPTPNPEPEPEDSVKFIVEDFKRTYSSVFGFDSVIPSSRDVLMLNLLFGIYGELVKLNEKFNDEEEDE